MHEAEETIIATYFQNHPIEYEKAIGALKVFAENGMFDE